MQKHYRLQFIGLFAVLVMSLSWVVKAKTLSESAFYNHPSVDKTAIRRFVNKMVNTHKLSRERVEADLANAIFLQDVIDKLNRPAEKTKTWPEYRAIFIQPERVQQGVNFINQYQNALIAAEQQYGVPINVIVGIIGVETKYGQTKGNTNVFDALATIAFGYPRRSTYFASELEHYMLYLKYQDPALFHDERVGSYAGAMGIPQFMPSSYKNHAIDFDGDGHRDLFDNPVDAIGSVAKYLAHFGWQKGQPIYVSLMDEEKKRLVQLGLSQAEAPASSFIANNIGTIGLQQVPPTQKVKVIRYDMGYGAYDYRLGLKNYRVIQRYNQFDYYVTAVTQLANEIARVY